MSWYMGVVTDETNFVIKEHSDPSWLIGQSLALQSGAVVGVQRAVAGELFGIDVTTSQPHGVPKNEQIWFQLATSAASDSTAKQQVPHYPLSTGAATASAQPAYPLVPTAAAPAQPAYPLSQPAYPLGPDFSISNISKQQPAYPSAAVSEAPVYPTLPSDSSANFSTGGSRQGNNSDPLEGIDHSSSVARLGYASNVNAHDDSSWSSSSSYDRPPAAEAMAGLLLAAALLTGQMFICDAIGASATKWLLVLVWTLLGSLVVGGIQVGVMIRMASKKSRMTCTMVFLSILSVVWVNAFGVPLAMVSAKLNTIDLWTANSSVAPVHCYRQPTQSFSPSTKFILLQEPQWTVDYTDWGRQKIASEVGETDSGARDGKAYNYCVAPLRYTGPVPCAYNMWAICYFESASFTFFGSCDAAAAAVCGWNFPANGVSIRTVVPSEPFFEVGTDDEINGLWGKALSLADSPSAASSIPKTMVMFNSDSPDDLDAQSDPLEQIRVIVMISMIATYLFVGLIVAVLGYVINVCDED